MAAVDTGNAYVEVFWEGGAPVLSVQPKNTTNHDATVGLTTGQSESLAKWLTTPPQFESSAAEREEARAYRNGCIATLGYQGGATMQCEKEAGHVQPHVSPEGYEWTARASISPTPPVDYPERLVGGGPAS